MNQETDKEIITIRKEEDKRWIFVIIGTGDVRKIEKKKGRKISIFEAYDKHADEKIDIASVVVDALGTGTDKLPK